MAIVIIAGISAANAQNGIADFEVLDLSLDKDNLLLIVKTYNGCLEYNSTARECLEGRGIAYFYLKEYDKALDDFNVVLATGAQKPFTLYCRGIIYKSKSNYDAAANDFNKANELLPDERHILLARLQTYRAKKNYPAALADLNQLLAKNPSDYAVFYERGNLYNEQRNYKLAVADFSQAIILNPKSADAYFGRGQTYSSLGNAVKSRADFALAAKLDPKYANKSPQAAVAPKTSAVKPLSGTAVTAAQTDKPWKRNVLTGTGISLESPAAFELGQDKPDVLSETQTAYVFWSLSAGNVFANVTYEVNSDRKTVRQQMDFSAEISGGSHRVSSSKITETTFLNQPAAILDLLYFDAKKNKEMKFLQFCFGSPGNLTTFTAVYPADDAAAQTTALKIYNSIKPAGERVAETSKMPPADWHWTELKGLRYETPTSAADTKCRADFLKFFNAVDCYQWSGLTIRIGYRQSAAAAPSAAQLAQEEIDSAKETNKSSVLNEKVDFSLEPFAVGGAEATKLKIVTGGSAYVTDEEIIFVRRGVEMWEVSVYHSLRWKFDDEAAERIIKSLQKNPLAANQDAPPPVLTDADRYERIGNDLRQGKDVSEADIKWALDYEMKHPKKKIDE